MHTWVRRGLRTALVTGGLLMLGTGIASADENVNPDLPPSPVDAGVSVPVSAGHVPLDTAVRHDVGTAVGKRVTTPVAAPVRPAVSRPNPLVRQPQPQARQVAAQKVGGQRSGERSDTLSGTFTAAQMTFPMRTANDAVTGLGAVRAEPAGWTRGLPRSTSSTSSNGSNRTGVIAEDNPVVHNGSLVVPDNAPLPGDVRRTVAHSPMAQRLPSAPQNGVVSGVPVVPSIEGVGLFGEPQAQSAPTSPGALPSAPMVASVGNVLDGASSRLPVRYRPEAPTSAVPNRQSMQSEQVLDQSPLDVLPGVSSVGGIVPTAQDEAPTSAVQSPDARSIDLPPDGPLPSVPTVGQAEDRVSSVPAQDAAGLPAQLVQSLNTSPVGPLPDMPTAPTAPRIAPVPVLGDVNTALSHTQVHPAEAPTSAVRPLQALQSSPLGARPSVPEVPSVPDVSSAPLAQSVMDTVPQTQAAVLPVSAASTSALPGPLGGLMQPLGQTTLAALPGVPMVGDGVDSPFGQLPVSQLPISQLPVSQLPVSPLAGAPSSARHSVDGSPLRTAPAAPGLLDNLSGGTSSALPVAQAAEVATSVPSLSPLGPLTGALPGVPMDGDGVDSLLGQLPVSQLLGQLPVSQLPISQLPISQLPVSQLPVSQLPVSPLAGAPSSARHSVDGSPLRTAPAAPGLLDNLSGTATSALPVAQAAEVPTSVPGLPDGKTVLGSLPGDPTAAVANAAPQVSAAPSSVRDSVNNSPFSALPGAPRLPSVPSAGSLAGDAADVSSSPTHVTQMTELPVSDVNTSNLPPAPVGSVSDSPAGRMFGVPTVREAATRSLAAAPVDQLAQVPGTISDSVNESPFASLPGDPRVPSVPSVPDLAVQTSSQPPASYVTGAPASAAHATQVFGKPSDMLPGVSDVDGIAGVLPVVQDLFPRI